jgi:hypothetical protein
MTRHWLAALTLFAAFGLATPTLQAGQGKGEDKGKGHAKSHGKAEQGWERRDGFEYRVFEVRDDRPPGWSRGKKTGWGNCGLPPGQAKKYGCRTYVYEGRPHYYYQDERGRIFVRRPIVEVHGSVDIVH